VKNYRNLAVCLGLLILPTIYTLASEMSHEETMVRTAYARLSYASQLNVIGPLAEGESLHSNGNIPDEATIAKQLSDEQLRFTLADFVIGNTKDIGQKKWSDLVSPPCEDTLEIQIKSHSFREGNNPALHYNYAAARWIKPQPIPPLFSVMAIGDVLALPEITIPPGTVYSRYASFSVTVSFEGKTRGPYKAMFLFGEGPKGSEQIQAHDMTTDQIPLGLAFGGELYPRAFLETNLRGTHIVSEWLASTQLSESTCSKWNDLCCDLARLGCGIAANELRDAMAKPIKSAP
jgi:hypothetical protein